MVVDFELKSAAILFVRAEYRTRREYTPTGRVARATGLGREALGLSGYSTGAGLATAGDPASWLYEQIHPLNGGRLLGQRDERT